MIEEINKYLNELGFKNYSYGIVTRSNIYSFNDDITIYKDIYNNVVINTLISILLSEEKIKLDSYICDFINIDNKEIKLFHLLTHSSGLDDNGNILFNPGEDVLYSEYNYKLLKDIIEHISNKKINIYIKEILDINNKYSIKDYTDYIKMVLHDGYYKNKKILDLTYIDMWFTPLFISSDNIRKTIGYNYYSDNTIYSKNNKLYTYIDRSDDVGLILYNIDNNKDVIEYIYKLLKKYDEIY